MYNPRYTCSVALVLTALLASSVGAAPTPEQKCQSARLKAAGMYAACERSAQAALETTTNIQKTEFKLLTCAGRYSSQWTKLQTQFPGTSCEAARFVDNGDGTVTDNLTTLQWEKKDNLDHTVNLADVHDADNRYTWSATTSAANGTVFTDFLATMNSGCFAGQCDWRLPARAELLPLLMFVTPCLTDGSIPCIDPAFGPSRAEFDPYWSSSILIGDATQVWGVDFTVDVELSVVDKSLPAFVRAVRGGS